MRALRLLVVLVLVVVEVIVIVVVVVVEKGAISDAMGMATSKSVLQISSAFLLLATRGSRRLRPLPLPLLLQGCW